MSFGTVGMAVDFVFNPELRLVDGTIIRDLDDALNFARAQNCARESMNETRSCICWKRRAIRMRRMPQRCSVMIGLLSSTCWMSGLDMLIMGQRYHDIA